MPNIKSLHTKKRGLGTTLSFGALLFGPGLPLPHVHADAIPCGNISYDPDTEWQTLVWRDCDTGEWHLRAPGGGRSSATYTGNIAVSTSFTHIAPYSFESNDILDTSKASTAAYLLNVSAAGQDGLDFSLASGSHACLDASGSVLVGPLRTAMTGPFDLTTLGACPSASAVASAGYAYLNDADTTNAADFDYKHDPDTRPFPRITTGPLKKVGTAEQFSKYHTIAVKPGLFRWLASVQQINPDTKALRIFSPFAYQGFNDKNPCGFGSGMPFGYTGSATTGCAVYAGHWLYGPGTRLRTAITATTTTLHVEEASNFVSGRYVVIYDGELGTFHNAEHARVTAVDESSKTLTLASRGLRSTARYHPVNAIVAEHVIGNGAPHETHIWTYNLSSECPQDSEGHRMNEAMAAWLAENYQKDGQGSPSNVKLEGILFDSDFHFIGDSGTNRRPDVDNDSRQDDGISPTGENLWGDGVNALYDMLRDRLPDALLVGGVIESRGYTTLNGTQLEGWPQRNISSHIPDYRELSHRLSTYSVQMHRGTQGPRYSEGINRVSTLLYPYPDGAATSNAGFRFSFGLMLLEDGYYGQQNSNVTDPWWDEYAVDTVSNSPTYGQAIESNPRDESRIREHAGWMGEPKGARYRVYDNNTFAPERNLLSNGDFDTALTNWTGDNVTLDSVTSPKNRIEGRGAMRISEHLRYSSDYSGAVARGPRVNLQSGREYTFAFAVKVNSPRTIQVAVGDQTEHFTIPAGWSRQVFTFAAERSDDHQIRFNVGRENTNVWVDAIYLFEGNANVFRRDFGNAIVVVNATPSNRTVDLGGTFKRIRGTGQDRINDGSSISRVTLPPYDAAILIRPEDRSE